jgi:4-diphosphocytidyl-2-C-methyl-D-erythritol kinase
VVGVQVVTRAKVNLFLRVLGARPDGFHDIETIFQTIDLADELSFTPRAARGIEVRFRPPDVEAQLPGSGDDLIARAWRALDGPVRAEGVLVEVDKNIPIGGGLGGGSANAAGALAALNVMWGLGLDLGALQTLALSLGSDVPFLLEGGTAIGRGRGEELTPLALGAPLWFVLGISPTGLSTRAMYERWAPGRSFAPRAIDLASALRSGRVKDIAELLANDLEEPALAARPELRAGKAALLEAGATGVVLSGSGPTLVGLAHDEAAARVVAAGARPSFDRIVVASSRETSIGLAPGARYDGR